MRDFVTVNDQPFYVVDEGTGPPILFVHGFPLDHSMWNAQIEFLSRQYRCIAPDLRGFGRNAATSDTLSMAQIADDLADLLVTIGIETPVTFCGLSMGGYIAWDFLRRHPAKVARLILCNTRSAADSPSTKETRYATAQRVLAEGTAFLADGMIEKLLAPANRELMAPAVTQLRQTILSTAPATVAAALHGMAERADSSNFAAGIQIPTLAIAGSEDILTPAAEMRDMAMQIAEATFVEIPEAGHMTPIEAPEAVNAAIEHFLSGSI